MEDINKEEFLQKREEMTESLKVKHTPVVSQVTETIRNNVIAPSKEIITNVFEQPQQRTTTSQNTPVQPVSSDPLSNVSRALNDAILPAKSQLSPHDPFNFLTSKDYLASFVFVSLLLVNLLGILG